MEAHQESSGGTPGTGADRVLDSYQVRVDAARAQASVPVPKQMTNGDEQNYQNFIGNFHKGLPHNALGEVNPAAYRLLVSAAREGTAAAFERVLLGGTGPDLVKLVNPLAGMAFDLEGTDSHQLAIPPIPSVASKELADEAVELYWQALCRDVNFTDYATDSRTITAAAELSKLKKFNGPRDKGFVTAQTLFRGFTAGDVIGPYVSQLMLKPFNYGPYAMTGQISTYMPDIDYMTKQAQWLACQNGQGPFDLNVLDPKPRHVRNGRDYTVYVHKTTRLQSRLVRQVVCTSRRETRSIWRPSAHDHDRAEERGLPTGSGRIEFYGGGRSIFQVRYLFCPPGLSRRMPAASLLSGRPLVNGGCVRDDTQGCL